MIAPMFVFAMGLTYGLSFRSRLSRDSAWNTYRHFLTRYLALIGMGYLITLVWQLSGIQLPSVNWGLLQALGAAGLIALPIIRLTTGWRFGIGPGMLAIYHLLLDRFWPKDVLIAPHNSYRLGAQPALAISTALRHTRDLRYPPGIVLVPTGSLLANLGAAFGYDYNIELGRKTFKPTQIVLRTVRSALP